VGFYAQNDRFTLGDCPAPRFVHELASGTRLLEATESGLAEPRAQLVAQVQSPGYTRGYYV
jgi:hypothetical protein